MGPFFKRSHHWSFAHAQAIWRRAFVDTGQLQGIHQILKRCAAVAPRLRKMTDILCVMESMIKWLIEPLQNITIPNALESQLELDRIGLEHC